MQELSYRVCGVTLDVLLARLVFKYGLKTRGVCYGITRFAKLPTSRYDTVLTEQNRTICCTEKGVYGTGG